MRLKLDFNVNDQSCLDPTDPKSNARVSSFVRNGKLPTTLFEDVSTLFDVLRRGSRVSNNGPCLGYRCPPVQKSTPYTWLKFDEVIHKCEMFARGLVPKFCQPGQQSYVGIYAQNRPEWIIAEHACFYYSMVFVPLYNTAGADAVKKVLAETELQIVIIDTMDKLDFLIKNRNCFETLKLVVLMDDIISYKPIMKIEAAKINLTISTMQEIIEIGEKNKQATAIVPPKPSDLAAICYTSGTGGNARGVMLSHSNYVANFSALMFQKAVRFTIGDVLLSFLPAAHCFERFMEESMLMSGGAIGFYSGNVLFFGDDLFHLRPTKMPGVPSLLNRVYNNTMGKINESKMARCLFPRAYAAKKQLLEKHIVCNDTIWDCLIFRKLRNYFGGRLKVVIVSSAPFSSEILTFMRIALGCVIVEAYGTTENSGAVCATLEGDCEAGHVGPPCVCNKIKLVEISEVANVGTEKAGEICIFGPSVFQGYFKDPETTAKVLDKDGYLHTGDIGAWTEHGTLRILGRKNSVFKLAQGEFIAPEKIENVYCRSQFISQVFVCGDKNRDYVVALVVPDFNNLKPALEPVIGPYLVNNPSAVCSNEATLAFITHDMHEKAVAAGLNHIEEVKNITLVPEPFTVENGLITPTFKLKRVACAKRYELAIAEMYKR